jgi:poly(hydroxyalkanoate) depolymerase family esterase
MPSADVVSDRLTPLEDFGANPGALQAHHFVPERTDGAMPLVLVLHGCTQSAAVYDHGSGWTQLGAEIGFAVLYAEQTRANNFNLCFNWYEREDSRRDGGEPESIRQMVAAMMERFPIDPARIFVTGLSAGGAMTSVMLATYPEVFAGGAIIAGLPFGSATTLPEAFDRMRGHGGPTGAALSALVEGASGHRGPWPTISVWHGSADGTVDASNAQTIIDQWRPLHGVGASPSEVGEVDGCERRLWRDASGRAVIEDYRVRGMGHGTPVSTLGEEPCGNAGAYMLENGISSTRHIAKFWGLAAGREGVVERPRVAAAATTRAPQKPASKPVRSGPIPAAGGVGKVIDDALRAAGLLR